MKVHIRLGKLEEIETLIELQSQSLLANHRDGYNEAQLAFLVESQAEARRAGCKEETLFVAEKDERIVGFSSLLDAYPYIGALYVHPDYFEQRIGSDLLLAVENLAIHRKFKRLWVVSSIASVGFYKKHGYLKPKRFQLFDRRRWLRCKLLQKELVPLPLVEKVWEIFLMIAPWLFWLIMAILPFLIN